MALSDEFASADYNEIVSMFITSIRLQNFRSYESYEARFDDHITVITGKNGTGKTNLLEAIYTLMQGSSFRTNDRDLVQYEKEWWRIDGEIDGHVRQVRFESTKSPAKQIVINDNVKRFSFSHRLPLVLFEPSDMLFISGSPSRRRDTVDAMISALSNEYKTALVRYNRVLLQRNNALKQYRSEQQLRDMLFVWDVSLASYAEVVVGRRDEFVYRINELLPYYYEQIAGELHDVELRYDHSLPPHTNNSGLMDILNKTIQRDIERRTSTRGPHRDDFTFYLSGNEAKISASRGETRSLILALKLAYRDILAEQFESQPILLLDDVFSELDETRRKNLLTSTKNNQIIITDTQAIDLPGGGGNITLTR